MIYSDVLTFRRCKAVKRPVNLRVSDVNKCVQSAVHLPMVFGDGTRGVVLVGAGVPQWVASAQLA